MPILTSNSIGLYSHYATTYGSGTYNSSTYNGQATAGTGSTGSPSGSSGILTNTGFDIAVIVTIACVIALAAVVIRVWRRPKRDTAVNG